MPKLWKVLKSQKYQIQVDKRLYKYEPTWNVMKSVKHINIYKIIIFVDK